MRSIIQWLVVTLFITMAGINAAICSAPSQDTVVGGPRSALLSDGADCAYAESAPISVNAPLPQYAVKKQRTDPATSLPVAACEAVTYRVQTCPTSTSGSMPLTNAILIDTLPNVPGLTAASVESSYGGTVVSGPPVRTVLRISSCSLFGVAICEHNYVKPLGNPSC